ncbi:MAG: SVM family protein [Candidatus Phytoplasma australasiaticum]|nr:SVM family protein [Candidatus Phytoplasma australasiaticum]MDV3199984.1 SVM family protein [Candidatus Phytoplasma australasiaticum]
MMQIKNKIYLLPLFLMIYLGLFLLININPVMAMNNKNKGKKIINHEISDAEVNAFCQLLKKTKQNIWDIRNTIPHLENASIREIEEWACQQVEKWSCSLDTQQTKNKLDTQQTKNKRLKTIDLNKTPEQN